MRPLRVLVVDDSMTVRKRLVEVLSRDPGLQVVGEAGDGSRAVELCRALRPDVVTMDMVMPTMNGLAATEQIMAFCPTPILIVSASLNRGEVLQTFDALSAGAADVIDKPSGDDISDAAWERELVARVRLVARIAVVVHPRARLARARRRGALASPATRVAHRQGPSLVAIGGSTGAPAAVAQVLRGLPRDFPAPILLVIHIGPTFARGLLEWLDELSPIPVRWARDGAPLPLRGTPGVLMAPAERHLVVRDRTLHLDAGPERWSLRPSVDVLFESIAAGHADDAVGCLLTGMGRDGAEGLLAIRRSGGSTLAQDEQSSVVFGMPGEAVRIGAAERVVPLDRIAAELVSLVRAQEPAA